MRDMTWQQMYKALGALCGGTNVPSLKMRPDFTWYVSDVHVEIARGGVLECPTQARYTPDLAVEECWRQYVTGLPEGAYLKKGERKFLWNGFMWEEQP